MHFQRALAVRFANIRFGSVLCDSQKLIGVGFVGRHGDNARSARADLEEVKERRWNESRKCVANCYVIPRTPMSGPDLATRNGKVEIMIH
jgi:hypothetical protein